MSAVWFRARAELRARWRAWLAIALLLGVFGGATAAAAAGARRTHSAYPRFLERAHSFDAFIGDFSAFNPQIFWQPNFDEIEDSGLVDVSARVLVFFGTEDDELAGPVDDAFGTSLNRPKMLAGRMPRTADEVSVPFSWEQRAKDLRVGDRVTIGFDEGPGELTLTVVGIHAMPGDFPPTDLLGTGFVASPAFTERWRETLPSASAMFVRLAPGATVADLEAWARERAGGKLTAIYRNSDQAQNVQRSFDLQAVALWMLAAGLALATVLVIGQSIARQASLDADDRAVLLALGMSRWQAAASTIGRAAAAGILGGGIAVAVAVAASPLFPRGLARVAEPDPGLAFDAVVLVVAFVALASIAVLASLVPAIVIRRPALVITRPSRAAALAARVGSPPSAVAGVRFALERGRGTTAVPVRSTILAVTLGLAALTSALMFGSNLDHLLETPRLYGRGWDHEYGFGGDFSAVPANAAQAAREDPNVEGAAAGTLGLQFDVSTPGGQILPVTGMALEWQVKDPVVSAPTEGRYPGRGEVVLGPRTMTNLNVSVGDRIDLALGGAQPHPVTVVGEVVLPPLSEQSQFGDGVFIHYDTLTHDLAPEDLEEAPPADQLLVRFSGAEPVPGQVEAFRAKLDGVDQDYERFEAADLVNFGRVQNMPLVLAGLLAALAAGALAHVLLTAIRRRRRDVAILKTLGFARRQARFAVASQASTVAGVSLALGIPLGVVAGRALWVLFASRAHVLVEHAVPWVALGLTIPGALLLANLIAVFPARAAARTRPALVLRAE